ncbi:hypothetical protein FLJC2902T_22470 [Flavobacterium limnosediminis JC2902]|uniref:Uncharacterized protein n=1 Tax=Flavobacterium limnosediminis JC2902 TaxID=1341181 RepID=V6SKH1_9FLAO|nr:hypothetical protein FLJC2902T_22470 [Flavobacterium limnosediminis JC2902]
MVVAVLFMAGSQIPVTPSLEVVGNADNAAPEQIAATCVKVGVTVGVTVIVIVVGTAHGPAFGVKVYVVVAVLFNDGDHVPTIPSLEVVGNVVNDPPAQIGATCVNVGVTLGVTVIVIVAVVAHSPASGVKVYVVVVVLFIAGDQVPVTPSFEAVGKAVSVPPEQIGATCVNVGVTSGFTVIVIVVAIEH